MISSVEKEKWTVLQVAPPQNVESGDYFYRVESPGRALSELDEIMTVVDITNIFRDN